MATHQNIFHDVLGGSSETVLLPMTRSGQQLWRGWEPAWGCDPSRPTLYLHGTSGSCHGLSQEQTDHMPQHGEASAESEPAEGAGAPMLVERLVGISRRAPSSLRRTG
jgi:hypothetical protein